MDFLTSKVCGGGNGAYRFVDRPARFNDRHPFAGEVEAKIWEAQLVQRNFAAGLRHCNELNGTNFYFAQRDRVLNLQDYRRSLDNLAAQGGYNPETR